MSIAKRFSLEGSVALVTGAGKGIGRAIALSYAEAGADVVVSARTQADLDTLCVEIHALGRRALAVVCDVNDDKQRQDLVAQAYAHFGKITHLVNNAGGGGPNDPLLLSGAEFTEMFSFNVTSIYALSQLCVPLMRESGSGNIVNVSSVAARYAQRHFSAYGTAKAAVNQLTRLLAQEFAPHIRVNAVAPGPTLTDALDAVINDQMRSTMQLNTPLKRLGTPEDIANAALFLASPASSWITGKILEIDGGAESTVWID